MDRTKEDLSRRSFLGVAAAAVGAATTLGLAACADGTGSDAKADEQPAWLPATWDYECDIAIVGYGGAGISAAITATQENLGEVLVLEAAPDEQLEGGNSKVCGQLIFIPKTVESAVKYQTALNGPYVVEPELVEAWAKNICENFDILQEWGADLQRYPAFSPEFPEYCDTPELLEDVVVWLAGGQMGSSAGWNILKGQEGGYPVEYDRRVHSLIYNPLTREIHGCIAKDSSDKDYTIKARKGVIVCCGGMENDPELRNYFFPIGGYGALPLGTPYNRGDSIRMFMDIGAQLWHMNNFPVSGYGIKWSGLDDQICFSFGSKANKAWINISPDGKRYMNEESGSLERHGKELAHGIFFDSRYPEPMHTVFGSALYDAKPFVAPSVAGYAAMNFVKEGTTNDDLLAAGIIMKADTVEELAKKIGVDPTALAETVTTYNQYCKDGVDPDFGRGEPLYSTFGGIVNASNAAGEESSELKVVVQPFALEPIEGPPYYAIQVYPDLINSQGGAKRSAKGEVLNTRGEAIPRLYAAGECGTIYSCNYNGGGNFSEAISSGRLAARSAGALTSWDSAEEE
jgi:succinate dehydrogenase/fumarate reductase flavoprotein subunit